MFRTIRLSHAFDRYEHEYLPRLRPSSHRRSLDVVKRARVWFKHDPPLNRITPNDIEGFLTAQLKRGVSIRTRNLYRATLHRVFQLCIRPWGLLTTNPAAGTECLRHDPFEPRLLTNKEYGELRRACEGNEMLWLFVTLGWETGARHGELLQLTWADVDLDQAWLTFRNDPAKKGRKTKGRRSRTLPLSSEAVLALREAPRHRSPWIFHHRKSKMSIRRGDRIKNMRHSFQRAAARVGLQGLRPHDMRHCFVTRKLAEGVSVQLVQRYVGHANLTTTLGYTHLVPEHLRSVVE